MPGNSGKLPTGKLNPQLLSQLIDKTRLYIDPSVRQGPGTGEDAAIITLPCCDLVIHTDPITEAGYNAGWLALTVAANDVATSGACPRWASVAILLPENADEKLADAISSDMGRAARQLGIDVIGGHTEVTPGLTRPIVVATVTGITCRDCALRTGDARPGDKVLIVGYAGLEGTSIIVNDFPKLASKCGLKDETLEQISKLAENISVVGPACLLAKENLVRAMHDATEGGIIGALVEVAIAGGNTVIVEKSKIPVHPTTRKIAGCLGIDPLKLISSGALIAVVPPDAESRALELLEHNGFHAITVGRIERGEPVLVLQSGPDREIIREPPPDEITKVWSQYGEKEREEN